MRRRGRCFSICMVQIRVVAAWLSLNRSWQMLATDAWLLPPPSNMGTQAPELEPPVLIAATNANGHSSTRTGTTSAYCRYHRKWTLKHQNWNHQHLLPPPPHMGTQAPELQPPARIAATNANGHSSTRTGTTSTYCRHHCIWALKHQNWNHRRLLPPPPHMGTLAPELELPALIATTTANGHSSTRTGTTSTYCRHHCIWALKHQNWNHRRVLPPPPHMGTQAPELEPPALIAATTAYGHSSTRTGTTSASPTCYLLMSPSSASAMQMVLLEFVRVIVTG